MYSALVMSFVKANFEGALQDQQATHLGENAGEDYEHNWSVILESVSCHCSATWRWIKEKTCGEIPDNENSLELQAAVCISHSLPELQREPEDNLKYVPDHNNVTKKVLRQTTLPVVPTRHQTFQRQLSHRLDTPKEIEFSICSLPHRATNVIGVINVSAEVTIILDQKSQTKTDETKLSLPELYKEELTSPSSIDTTFPEMEYAGNLLFALRYDDELESLIVKILEATDLPIKDGNGSSDPYVKVCLLPDSRKKFKTKVHRKTLNPVFNETFSFSVSYEELRRRYLQFTVYDFDRLSRHDLIGHVVLNNLLEGTDLRKEDEYTMKILCPPEDKVHLGELMVRLCYLPMAGRLTITIIRARRLKCSIDGKPDPYVKVYLTCQGKRIRKQKTHVRCKTLYPMFNEALFFDIPEKNIDDVTLILQVMDYERFRANAFMGCAAIGSKVIGIGREHWLEMRMNPRTPMTQWYTLIDSIPGINLDRDGNAKSLSLSCLNGR